MSPVDLNYGPSHPGEPLAPISLVQTCTGFSTSTYDPSIQTFTVSLKGSAWQTRTQTVSASTETWTSTFARSYIIEYPNEFFTGDATVVTEWPDSMDLGTTATRRFVPLCQNAFHSLQMLRGW
jgi:hypothetical protein